MKRCYLALLSAIWMGPLLLVDTASADEKDAWPPIRKALTFHASFDRGTDADVAGGDRRIHFASNAERKDSKPGLPAGEVELASGRGRLGGNALRFIKRTNKVVLYRAAGNMDYRKKDWSGTVSFWLNLDPNIDLGDWYCDPIQITDKTWNQAAIWVDFSKDDRPKQFRLGTFADLKVWNPNNRDYEKMSAEERPLVTVVRPPFTRGRWTHVAITFERFNTGKADGSAKLYLDGKLQGSLNERNQFFTWDTEKAAIQIGMSYVGLFDDLAIFNRSLSGAEVLALHSRKEPLSEGDSK